MQAQADQRPGGSIARDAMVVNAGDSKGKKVHPKEHKEVTASEGEKTRPVKLRPPSV